MASDAGPQRRFPVCTAARPRAHALLVPALLFVAAVPIAAQDLGPWPQHSMERPRPRIIDPGAGALPVPPPSDAVVLFDGTNLANWEGDDSTAAKWRVADGYMEVVPGAGGIHTRQGFGDCQLHVEWQTPTPPHGESQERGNSGVFLMGRYELQVLDSYQNITYADGQAAAIYGQYPPLMNASRPPGVWQSYDIIFHRPHFSGTGAVESPARFTVFHNGVLVQDNVVLVGPTANMRRPPYTPHADALPLGLQDHGVKVRFRNIWIRALQ